MKNSEIESYLAKIRTLETIVIAICAALPADSSKQILSLIKAAEKNISAPTKTELEEHLKLVRDHFSPYLDALQIGGSGQGDEILAANIKRQTEKKELHA